MRIISGSRRGKKLITLEGMSVRPTADRVKEALFSILQGSYENRAFLDLFAGSGQIGLEAVSRGAALAVLTEQSPEAVRVIEKNIASVGFEKNVKLVRGDALAYLRGCGETFAAAFLDPPYRTGLIEKALPLLWERMAEDGVIACEHPKDEQPPETAGEFSVYRQYTYGKIQLTVYRRTGTKGQDDT